MKFGFWDTCISYIFRSSYLKFLKPHQRQYKYFSRNPEEATSLVKAASNIPNLNPTLPLLTSHFVVTRVTFSQYFRSDCSKLLHSRKVGRQETSFEAFSLVHSICQQENCLPIDNKYHEAPNTCNNTKSMVHTKFSPSTIIEVNLITSNFTYT